jgi:hypothetical protein
MPSSASDDDDADSWRVIGPEDFVKEPAEEERALAEALAKMAAETAAQQTAEEAKCLAALHAVEAFQEREATHAQRLADRVAEAVRVLRTIKSVPGLVQLYTNLYTKSSDTYYRPEGVPFFESMSICVLTADRFKFS